MKTKLIALFTIFTLIISQLPISVMAVSSDYLTVGDVSGEVGDIVTVEVKATKDLTVDDLMVELTYDEDKLSTTGDDITVSSSLKNGDAGVADGVISMGSYDSNTYTIPAGTTLMIVKFKILSAGANTIKTALDSENSETDTLYSDTVSSKVEGKAPVVSATGITLNKTEVTVSSGKTVTLEATVIPENATNQEIEWSTSDAKVATVDNGVVKGIKKGTATITAKTKDGGYSKICKVTVDCSHTNTTTYKAEASTCLTQGHNEYVKCKDCGEIISGSDKLLPLADHTYGTLISEKEPTHTSEELKDGVKAHYECSVCGKLFIDENGKKKEVKEADLKIVAEHLYEEEWKTNAENHWKECGCGNIVDQAKHSGGTATCTKKAICEVCGVEYGEVNPENHEHTEVRNKKDATCEEEGNTGDTYCVDENKLVKAGETVPATGHKGGTATCTKKAVCEVCGKEYGEVNQENHEHTEVRNKKDATCEEEGNTGDTYCVDENKLVKAGEKVPATGHKGGTATCTKKAVCEVCGKEYGEVNPENHEHTEVRNKKDATTREEGYTGDTYCIDEDKLVKKGEAIPVKTPEIKVEPKENNEEDKSAALVVEKLMAGLLGNKNIEEMSDEDNQKLLDAIYDEKEIKVNVVTEIMDEKDIEDDVKLVKEKLSTESKIAEYYNVEILVEIEGQEDKKITKLDNEISISLPIPKDLPKVEEGYEREYIVIRVHNGYVTELKTTVQNGNVVFTSDRFSTYAIAYKDVAKTVSQEDTNNGESSENNEETTETTTSTSTEKEVEKVASVTDSKTKDESKKSNNPKTADASKKSKNPKTGDNIILWISLFVISGLSFVVSAKWNKKRLTGKH